MASPSKVEGLDKPYLLCYLRNHLGEKPILFFFLPEMSTWEKKKPFVFISWSDKYAMI